MLKVIIHYLMVFVLISEFLESTTPFVRKATSSPGTEHLEAKIAKKTQAAQPLDVPEHDEESDELAPLSIEWPMLPKPWMTLSQIPSIVFVIHFPIVKPYLESYISSRERPPQAT